MVNVRFEGEASGVGAEVLLNDIPIDRDPTGVPRIVHNSVNHWILAGQNELVVRLSKPQQPDANERFECELISRENSPQGVLEYQLVNFRWQKSASPLEDWPGAEVLRKNFTLEGQVQNWAWQGARQGELTSSDRLQILGLVAELHRAVSERALENVLALLAIQHREMADANSIEHADYRNQNIAMLRAYFSSDRYRIDPIELSRLKFESRANGRLVFVTDLESRTPVRGVAGSVRFQLPSAFSRLAQGWTIVR